MTFQYLFDSFIKEVSSINITLEYLVSETIGKRFFKKKALFNFFNRFKI